MNLTQLFDLSFRGRRHEVALEFAGRAYTFGEIDDRSNRMAALFRALFHAIRLSLPARISKLSRVVSGERRIIIAINRVEAHVPAVSEFVIEPK